MTAASAPPADLSALDADIARLRRGPPKRKRRRPRRDLVNGAESPE